MSSAKAPERESGGTAHDRSLAADGGEARHRQRFPLACGAIGVRDERAVARIATALGPGLSIAHQDDEAILYCDRPPIRWQHQVRQGLCWSDGIPRDERVTSWQDAARSLAACGLVIDEEGTRLHTSVAGIAPIYYREVGGATYFASRIDPLVAAFDERVSIDWDAWASIFLFTTAIRDRTPFAEIRRLPPYSVVSHAPGQGPRVHEFEWPWAQPDSRPASPEAVVEALREAIGALPAGEPVTCPLSGGWDSRLLLALLSERGDLELSAVTLQRRRGGHDEAEYARGVAAAMSVPLREITPPEATPWGETTEIMSRTDYQTTHHDWFMPLVNGVRGRRGLVADGFAGDVLCDAKPVSEAMLDSLSWDEGIRLVWDRVSNWHSSTEVLSDRLAAAFTALAWRQWTEQARPLSEHPACISLTIYRTRTLRGIALAPTAVLGADADVRTPFTDDRVARAGLMLPMRAKVRDDAYRRLFELVNPAVGNLPSTHDPAPRGGPSIPRPQPGSDVVRVYRDCLEQSPLRADINPALLKPGTKLPDLIVSPLRNHHVLRAVALLSQWHGRYADKLREINPGDVLG